MKNKVFGKVAAVVVAALIAICSFFALAGCAPAGDEVVNLSLNPQIELIVDANDKVVSVNALNDEGNVIIANATFVGLSVEDAVNLFVKVTNENGFMVQGEIKSGENELKISVSGEDAKAVYSKIKASVNTYLEENELNLTFSFEDIDIEYIRGLVQDAMGELEESELKDMSKQELMALLKQSREETKEILSQELKDLYYQLRETEFYKAKIEKITAIMAEGGAIWDSIVNNFNAHVETLTEKANAFVEEYVAKFIAESSEYQQKVQEYVLAKKALLEERLAGTINAATEQAVAAAEAALDAAKGIAQVAVSKAQSAINTALKTVVNALEMVIDFIDDNVGAIETAVDGAIQSFKESFIELYGDNISANPWMSEISAK